MLVSWHPPTSNNLLRHDGTDFEKGAHINMSPGLVDAINARHPGWLVPVCEVVTRRRARAVVADEAPAVDVAADVEPSGLCLGTTKAGNPCMRRPRAGSDDGYCNNHAPKD